MPAYALLTYLAFAITPLLMRRARRHYAEAFVILSASAISDAAFDEHYAITPMTG